MIPELLEGSARVPSLRLQNGLVQGRTERSYSGRPYMIFDGIPYAKPPLKDLRFEPPQPAAPWNGTLFATKRSTCIAIVHVPDPPGGLSQGTEDCLYLSVKVPGKRIIPMRNYDVLIYIHGGSYSFGTGFSASGKYIMDRDVILVSMNYRLGIFGFLSTEDSTVPGNLGLKDQTLALKWVQDNIAHFGGNPKSVTINGLSAGASSVQYHIASPLSKGLFHKAIAMSGSAFRTMQAKPLEKVKTMGRRFNCNVTSTKLVITCLKYVDANELLEATRVLRPWLFNPFGLFLPVVDKWSDNPFLPHHPMEIFKSRQFNHVPFISSSVADEGLYPGSEFIYKDSYLPELNNNWDTLAPLVLQYIGQIFEEESKINTKLIREEYFQDKPISKATFRLLIRLLSDRFFDYKGAVSMRVQSNYSDFPVYTYRFNYRPEKVPSLSAFYSPTGERMGIGHGDDNFFLYGLDIFPEKHRTRRDEKMMNFFLDLYVHFMKFGNVPVNGWMPVKDQGRNTLNYLDIRGPEQYNMKMEEGKIGNPDFWDKITLEYI